MQYTPQEKIERKLMSNIFRMEEHITEQKRSIEDRNYAIIGLGGWIVGNLLVTAYLIYTVW